MKFDLFRLERTRAIAEERLAILIHQRVKRDHHLRQRAARWIRGIRAHQLPFILNHAHNFVVVALHADGFPHRRREREELRHDRLVQHTHRHPFLHFQIGEEATLHDLTIAHLRIHRQHPHHLPVDAAIEVPDVFRDEATRHHDRNARHRLLDLRDVTPGDTVFADEAAAFRIRALPVRRLHALQDDVLAAQLANLLLRLVAGSFADRQHRHHGGHAENHAQGRQKRAQLVKPDRLQAQRKRSPQMLWRRHESQNRVPG